MRYTSIDVINNNLSYCALCRKLKNKDIYKKTYSHIPNNLEKCYTPDDIERLKIYYATRQELSSVCSTRAVSLNLTESSKYIILPEYMY